MTAGLSTIRDAHNALVLKGGIVAEQGTHEKLLARGGTYADLYRVKFAKTTGELSAAVELLNYCSTL